MSGSSAAEIAQLIQDIDSLIDQALELGNSLDLIKDGGGEAHKDDNVAHLKRSKLALVLLEIRNRSERLLGRIEGGRAPHDLNLLLTRLMSALSYLDRVDDCRLFYDSVAKAVSPEGSAWFLAEAATTMVNAYLSQNRQKEAVDFYLGSLHLNRYEEAAIGLVRAAFYLVSRLVMDEKMEIAREIYDTMERFGGGRTNLTLVDPSNTLEAPISASKPPLPAASRQAPNLTLVQSPASFVQSEGGGPCDDDEGNDYIGIVRAQAAVNVISGYAMTGQIDKAQEVFRAMPDPDDVDEYVNLRSMASVNLVCAYIRNRRWDRAMGVLDEIRELGRLSDNAIYQAKAVVEIIGYTEEDKLEQAQRLYESLEGIGDDPEFNRERMRAAGNLVYAAGEYGRLELARRIYDTLVDFGDSRETLLVRAAATLNLMSDYCASYMIPEAEGLFMTLEGFENIPEIAESKAQAAFNLMCCHIRRGRYQMAEDFYARIKTYGDEAPVVRMLAHATFGLVTEYLKIDQFEAALAAYAHFAKFDRTVVYMLEQAKAMYNLVQYCCDKGLRTLARDRYREFYDIYLGGLKYTEGDDKDKTQIESYFEVNGDVFGLIFHDLEQTPREDRETELCEYLSDSASLLVSQFSQNMRYKEAGEVFETLMSLAKARPVKPVVSNALQASFEMVIYLMGDGHLKQAASVFDRYDEFPATPEVRDMIDEQRIQSGLHIIENSSNLPKIKLLFDRLSEFADGGKYSHYLAQAALRYGELLCAEGDFIEARRVYERLTTFGETKRVHLCRLQLAILLLTRYLAVGDSDSAETLYATLKKIGRSKQLARLRDQASRLVDKIFKLNNVIRKLEQPEPQEAMVKGPEPGGPRPAGRGVGSEDA